MDNEYNMVKALSKLDDIKSYVNVLTSFLTGTGTNTSLVQDWLNENIDQLKYYIMEYFSGDSEIIHEIDMLSGYINYDVRNLKGVHEIRTEVAKSFITNKIVDIENLIKNRLSE